VGDALRYRLVMTSRESGPAQKLAELLETLPSDSRQEITAWLLGRPSTVSSIGGTWGSSIALRSPTEGLRGAENRLRRLAGTLPAGEDSQLVTIRLPAERHAELRAWCADHGFTMAAVVRGLVERFLEEQGRGAPAPPAATPEVKGGS
jgi:hypothetical protein